MRIVAEDNEITPVIKFYRFSIDSSTLSQKWRSILSKKQSGSTQIIKLEKKQGQIWNQRPFISWRPLLSLPF